MDDVAWDAPHLYKMARLAIEGVVRRGGAVTKLTVHPEDWDMMVEHMRRIEGRGKRDKPNLTLYGYKVELTDGQDRGDIRAWSGPVVV